MSGRIISSITKDRSSFLMRLIYEEEDLLVRFNRTRDAAGNRKRMDIWSSIARKFNEKFFGNNLELYKSVQYLKDHFEKKKSAAKKELKDLYEYRRGTGGGATKEQELIAAKTEEKLKSDEGFILLAKDIKKGNSLDGVGCDTLESGITENDVDIDNNNIINNDSIEVEIVDDEVEVIQSKKMKKKDKHRRRSTNVTSRSVNEARDKSYAMWSEIAQEQMKANARRLGFKKQVSRSCPCSSTRHEVDSDKDEDIDFLPLKKKRIDAEKELLELKKRKEEVKIQFYENQSRLLLANTELVAQVAQNLQFSRNMSNCVQPS